MSTWSYLALQKQIAEASRAIQPSYVDAFLEMEKALGPFRRSHLALAETIKASCVLARFQEIAQANQRLISAFDKITVNTQWIEDLANVHASWMRSIQPVQNQLAHLHASAKLTLTVSSQIATIAEKLYTRIDFDRLQRAFTIQDDIVAQIQKRLGDLTGGFDVLARSIEALPKLTALPSFVMPRASREVLLTGHAVVELSPHHAAVQDAYEAEVISEIREETSNIPELLSQVNPALAKAYQGARDALVSGSVDRGRHALVSLREMWGHLLRHLAPDEKVLPWVSGKGADLVHDGKPTRNARVLYVCRGINHGPLTDFLDLDTRALVKLLELFNRVHQLETGLTDAQLNALMLRADGWLTFIIQISEGESANPGAGNP